MKMVRRVAWSPGETPRGLSNALLSEPCARENHVLLGGVLSLILLGLTGVEAQQPAEQRAAPTAAQSAELAVAATVNGVPIHAAEVEQRVRQSLGGRDATPQAHPATGGSSAAAD